MLNQQSLKKKWVFLEKSFQKPVYCTGVERLNYKKFNNIFLTKNNKEIVKIVDKLYSGKIFIIKKAFSKKFVERVKLNFAKFTKKYPSSFHKMLENCPNFHRIIDEDVTKKYSMRAIKHSGYFFPWNKDELRVFNIINKRWRLIKFLGGRKYKEFEKNTPKNGVVDRIQVLRYPYGGELELHSDPFHNQKMFISIYLSKRGSTSDYQSGGFYALGENKKEMDLEKYIDEGDMGFGYATIMHGVKKINSSVKNYNWRSNKGRWFIGLYSNDSDEIKNRKTSKPIKSSKK